MANPNLTTITAAAAGVLAEAQLGSSATDFTVPAGKAWKPGRGTICNTTNASVAVSISILSSSGGTPRRVLSNYPLAAGDTKDITAYLPAMLPEGGIIRALAATATAVDLLVSGTVLG